MSPKIPPLNRDFSLFPLSALPAEKIADFLKSPLTDAQLQLIGEISTLWNSVHHRLQYFVWQVADWGGGIGALVTADLQAVSLVTLAHNITGNRITNDFLRECADATIDLFDELRIVRNKVLHGLPIVQLDGTVSEFSDSTARSGKGLKITTRKVSTPELETLLDDIGLLAVAVEGIIQQKFILDAANQDKMKFDLVSLRQVLERAMMTQVSHVQERRDYLHRQRQNTGTPPPPPQS
jgi:hypothetical protein